MTPYVGPIYDVSTSVRLMHYIPRFGHHNDITEFFSFYKTNQVDYVLGVLFFPLFLIVLYIYWAILIITFKCMGSERVGFLSGSQLREFPSWLSLGKDDYYLRRSKGLRRCFNKRALRRFFNHRVLRAIVVLSGILTIASCLLIVKQGLKNVESILTILGENILQIKYAVKEAVDITNSLARIGIQTGKLRDEAVVALNDFCPPMRSSPFLKSFDIDGLIERLDQMSNAISEGAASLESNLKKIAPFVLVAEAFIDDCLNWIWQPAFILVPYIFLTSCFVVGTMMSHFKVSTPQIQFIECWFVLPSYSFLISLAWIFLGVSVAIVIVNSDLCFESRAGTDMIIGQVLGEKELQRDGLLYDIIVFYAMGCRDKNPYKFIDLYEKDIKTALAQLQLFQSQIDQVGVDELSEYCKKDVSPAVNILKPLASSLVELLQIMGRTMSQLSCQKINENYLRPIHQAFCVHSVDALTWTFFCGLMISTCGMAMITFRSSWLNHKKEDNTLDYMECTDDGNRNFSTSSSKKSSFDNGASDEESIESRSLIGTADDSSMGSTYSAYSKSTEASDSQGLMQRLNSSRSRFSSDKLEADEDELFPSSQRR